MTNGIETTAAARRTDIARGILATVLLAPLIAVSQAQDAAAPIRNLQLFANPSGAHATYNVNGRIDTRGAFFQSLGTNGRSCSSCHLADQGFTIVPSDIRARYESTHGNDPLFAAVDGANCPNVKRADRRGHSLLLQHGLIRTFITLPANAQFSVSVIHDPYGCALTPDPATGQPVVSEYRRPLPTTNLNFLSTIMFDGRETVAPLATGSTFLANLSSDLSHQVISAVTIHAQGTVNPTPAKIAEIVNFELGLFTAQAVDDAAGLLEVHGALGGPLYLGKQDYYPGTNDVLGADPTGTAFTSSSMTLFSRWDPTTTRASTDYDDDSDSVRRGFPRLRSRAEARQDIAAGETLFNTAPLTITNVRGLNDNAALGKPTSFQGTCTTCHDAPNVGDHSLPLPLDIGVAHSTLPSLEADPAIAAAIAELDMPDLPVYLVSGCPNPFNPGQTVSFYSSDLGKGAVTGLCADVNRVKGPVLRDLAARAPYFHNGAAANLMQIANFYNQRFQMSLTQEQKEQLVAFLNSL